MIAWILYTYDPYDGVLNIWGVYDNESLAKADLEKAGLFAYVKETIINKFGIIDLE